MMAKQYQPEIRAFVLPTPTSSPPHLCLIFAACDWDSFRKSGVICEKDEPNIVMLLWLSTSCLADAANSVSSPPIMPFTDFYNITLEHIDFMEEYRTWQNYGNSNRSEICVSSLAFLSLWVCVKSLPDWNRIMCHWWKYNKCSVWSCRPVSFQRWGRDLQHDLLLDGDSVPCLTSTLRATVFVGLLLVPTCERRQVLNSIRQIKCPDSRGDEL